MKNFTLKLAVIVVCMIAALTISCFALSDASTTAVYGTIKVDGKIDAAWEKANKEDIVLADTETVLNAGDVAVDTGVTGVLRTMWDEDYFYILVEVDKHGMALSTNFGGREETDDCADICIGLDGFFGANVFNEGYPNSGVFRVLTSGEKTGHGAGWNRFQHEFRGKMVETSDSTYVVEYAFPWPTLNFTLHQESVVALDIQINVADSGKRIGVVNWSSTPATTWRETTECGIVYLEGIENMGYPTKAETLPKAKPELIELYGTIGYMGIDLSDGTEMASRFVVQSGTIKDITVECPSWMDSTGCLTFRIYEWKGDYKSTVKGKPLYEIEHVDFPDNSSLHLAQADESGEIAPLGFGKGEYLLWVGNGNDDFGQGVGVYTKDTSANDPRVIASYIDGEVSNKVAMIANVLLDGAEAIVYPNDPVTEDTTAEETTAEETTAEETTVEETTAEETNEETTAEESSEETTAEESSEETTAEESSEETTEEEGGEIAPPTADYMAIAALAAIACGVVLTLGKKR